MKDGVIQSSYHDSQYTTLSEVMRLYLIIMGTWGERTPQAFSTFHPPIPIPIILYSLAPELLPSWVTLPPKREAREYKGIYSQRLFIGAQIVGKEGTDMLF